MILDIGHKIINMKHVTGISKVHNDEFQKYYLIYLINGDREIIYENPSRNYFHMKRCRFIALWKQAIGDNTGSENEGLELHNLSIYYHDKFIGCFKTQNVP